MIENGEVYYFETNDFIKKVIREFPIELYLDVILIEKETNEPYDLDNLDIIFEEGKLDLYSPTLRISFFNEEFIVPAINRYFNNRNDIVINNIIRPCVEGLHNILNMCGVGPKQGDLKFYHDIETRDDVEFFKEFSVKYVSQIFKALNKHESRVKRLIEKAYERIGFIANRFYVLKHSHDPDIIFMDETMDDEYVMSVYKSKFATTYFYYNED